MTTLAIQKKRSGQTLAATILFRLLATPPAAIPGLVAIQVLRVRIADIEAAAGGPLVVGADG